MSKDTLLTILILVGLVAGILVGQFVLHDAQATTDLLAQRTAPYQTIGEIVFIRPLKMLIIPLVFVSVVVGVTSIGDPERLGLVGGATLVFYFTTMLVAVLLGLILAKVVSPGVGVDPDSLSAAGQAAFETERANIEAGSERGVFGAFGNLLQQMIPDSVLGAAVEGNTLGVVFVSILLGLALVLTREPARPVIAVFEGLFQALIRLVVWIIWLAPIGIFFIVASKVGQAGLGELAGPIGSYAMTVILGLLIHALVTLPLLLWIFTRTNPYVFLLRIRKPIITAFSTASSSATLPITIEECQTRGGCSRRASNFVLPLGATVNMDGTALYQAVAVSFLFQMFAYDLSLTQQLIILITATLAAIGAAGIPSAGLVTMAIVITAVNSSLETIPDAPQLPLWTIGIILGVDRILDMCRTAVNVWGDSVGARIITRLAPDTEESKEQAYA